MYARKRTVVLGAFGDNYTIHALTAEDDVFDTDRVKVILSTKDTANRPDDNANFILVFPITEWITFYLATHNYGDNLYWAIRRDDDITWHKVSSVS